MLYLMTFIGYLLTVYLVGLLYRKADIVRCLVAASVCYASAYLVVSGLLLSADGFTMTRTVTVIAILAMAADVLLRCVLGYRLRTQRLRSAAMVRRRAHSLLVKYGVLAIILVAAALTAWSHHAQIRDTGQDEGLYQARAMFYIGGHYDNVIEFPEYSNISIGWERDNYVEMLRSMDGYYFEEWDEDTGHPMGVLHGVPTFSALLALWGALFGLDAIAAQQVACYLLMIAGVFLLCENLHFRRTYGNLAALLCALSPMALWSAQNLLTEIVMGMLLVGFFVFYTDEEEPDVAMLGVLPLMGICFCHITVTMMMPFFVLLYWIGYWMSRDRRQLYQLLAVLIAYGLGYGMMETTARHYTMGNFTRIFHLTKELLNEGNIRLFIWAVIGLTILATILQGILLERRWRAKGRSLAALPGPKRRRRQKEVEGERHESVRRLCRIASWGVVLVVALLFAYVAYREWDTLDDVVLHFLLLGYIVATGVIFFPIAVYATLKRGGRLLRRRSFMAMALTMYYFVAMTCILVMPLIRNYYYYARYVTPYLFLPIVMAGYVLHRLPRKLTVTLCAVVGALMVWMNPLLYTAQDKTYTEYRVIANMVSCFGEGDAVLISEQGYGAHKIYTLPIKALTEADVYFLNVAAPIQQLRQIQSLYDNIFVLEYNEGKDIATLLKGHDSFDGRDTTLVYRDTITATSYEVDPTQEVRLGVIPNVAVDMSGEISLWRVEQR